MNTFDALMKISGLLANNGVKESLDYYNEPSDSAPLLSECVHYMEELLASLPEDIKERYLFELNSIENNIADLKKERYYERIQRCGIPLISTIGERLQYRISLLQIAVETGQLGFIEQYIDGYSGSQPLNKHMIHKEENHNE